MKSLNLKEMEVIEGGARPTGTQIMCYLGSVAYGLIWPPMGILAGAICLFAD